MDPRDILLEATAIARDAQTKFERQEFEETVRELEDSDVPVLRSLARTYRMLQRPFY